MRIYTTSSSPLDYCRLCAPADTPGTKLAHTDGPGPDGRGDCYGYDAEHPDYDGEFYRCHQCRRPLTQGDA